MSAGLFLRVRLPGTRATRGGASRGALSVSPTSRPTADRFASRNSALERAPGDGALDLQYRRPLHPAADAASQGVADHPARTGVLHVTGRGALGAVLEVHRGRVRPQGAQHGVGAAGGRVIEDARERNGDVFKAGDELGAAVAQSGDLAETARPGQPPHVGDIRREVPLGPARVVYQEFRDLGIEERHGLPLSVCFTDLGPASSKSPSTRHTKKRDRPEKVCPSILIIERMCYIVNTLYVAR